MEHTPYDAMQMPEQNPLHIQTAIALGKTLVKSLPRMGKVQMKLFFFAMLEHIDWRRSSPGSNIVILDNQLVKSRLGWNMKSDAAAAKRVRDGLNGMIQDCMVAAPADENVQKNRPPDFRCVWKQMLYCRCAKSCIYQSNEQSGSL